MCQIKFKEIATITAGQAAPKEFSNNGLPFIRAGHLEELLSGSELNKIPKINNEIAKKYKLKKLPKGSILFAKSGMSAKKNRIYISSEDSYFVSHLAAILPSENFNTNYLARYLNWFNPTNLILDDAYPSIRLEDIKELEIPLPDLSTQQKIANILDKADELRQCNKQLIEKYDVLTQSLFLDMFGDVKLNVKKWKIVHLENVCSNIIDCPHSTPQYSTEITKFPCIRTTELKNGEIDWSKMKYLNEENHLKRISRLKPIFGDIIYGREGTFGEAAIIPYNVTMSLGQRVMLFRSDRNIINNKFLHAVIRSKDVYNQALKVNTGSTVGHVNVKDIKKFKIICPPLNLQNQFAERVQIIENQKQQAQEALEKSEALFQSLLQKAFKGELN